jgi:cytochrome c553
VRPDGGGGARSGAPASRARRRRRGAPALGKVCTHLRNACAASPRAFCDTAAALEPSNPLMNTSIKHIVAGAVLLAGAALVAAPVAENWENSCAKCHGADGKGQTKVGKKLGVKDYTDAKVQAALKDDEMTKAIVDGVKDKAGKETMKGFKGELSDQEVKDLVAYVRKFKT